MPKSKKIVSLPLPSQLSKPMPTQRFQLIPVRRLDSGTRQMIRADRFDEKVWEKIEEEAAPTRETFEDPDEELDQSEEEAELLKMTHAELLTLPEVEKIETPSKRKTGASGLVAQILAVREAALKE